MKIVNKEKRDRKQKEIERESFTDIIKKMRKSRQQRKETKIQRREGVELGIVASISGPVFELKMAALKMKKKSKKKKTNQFEVGTP